MPHHRVGRVPDRRHAQGGPGGPSARRYRLFGLVSDFAAESGRGILGSYVLSNLSPQVLEALKKPSRAEPGDAVAIIEARYSSIGVAAADRAVKHAPVRLIRLVPGEGITGKSYFVLCGTVAAVEAGAEAAREMLGKHLVDAVVLAKPEEALLATLGK